MGLSVEDEFRCPKSGYSIDMRVHEHARQCKESEQGSRQGGQWRPRGLFIFSMQVASWCDLDEEAAC
jgi:hypothetical protein